jgi:hypothetical protein
VEYPFVLGTSTSAPISRALPPRHIRDLHSCVKSSFTNRQDEWDMNDMNCPVAIRVGIRNREKIQ